MTDTQPESPGKRRAGRPSAGSKNAAPSEENRENERKWTKAVWALGWTGIPFVLLERQKDLGLEPLDFNVLVQLLKHWWREGDAAWPTKRSIAQRIGKSEKTVQRSIAHMQTLGLVEYTQRFRADGGKGPNAYTFNGLVEKLKPMAKEEGERRSKKGGKADD